MTQNYPGKNKVKHNQSTEIYVGLIPLKAKLKFKILRKIYIGKHFSNLGFQEKDILYMAQKHRL